MTRKSKNFHHDAGKHAFLYFLTIVLSLSAYGQPANEKFSAANRFLLENDFANALKCYNELIRETADSVMLSSVYGYAASCYENQQNDSMAVAYYRKAVEYKAVEYAVYTKLYSLAKKSNDIGNQEFALIKKAEVFPAEKDNDMEKLANLYAASRQADKLLALTNRLLEASPENYKYCYLKAFALQSSGNNREAESWFKKALAIQPDDYGSNLSLGMMLYNEAGAAFEKEQARYEKVKNPKWNDYQVYILEIERVRGMYKKAQPYLEKACRINCTDQITKALEKLKSRCNSKL